VRLRVSENTKGAQIPWDAQKIQAPFTFFDRAPDAPPVQGAPDQVAAIRERPMRELSIQDAYTAALARDTMQGYEDFLAAYPGDPLARRVRRFLLRGARRSRGAAPIWLTHRRPIGPICSAIRRGRMRGTREGVWRS